MQVEFTPEPDDYIRIDLRQFPPRVFKDRESRADITIHVDRVGRLTITKNNAERLVDIPDWNRAP